MTVPGRRPQRVAEQIREEISALLQGEIKDPRIGFATITDVKVTPDLRAARVFVSVYGSAEEQKESLAGFRAAAAFIRRELARRMGLRHMPELTFTLDHTAEYASHIEELIQQTHIQPSEPPPPAPDPTRARRRKKK